MLGKELKAYRKKRGYLQKEIAETLGMSVSSLSRIERGKRDVTPEEKRKILSLFPDLGKGSKKKYTIYTDGGCEFNPNGPGGIGVVILDEENKLLQEISKGYTASTNNRMELLAAIEGLRMLPAGVEVIVISDSQYLVCTMEEGWKRNKNRDLWKELDKNLCEKKVTFKWIRGHNGNQWNERCDELATAGINSSHKAVDKGYVPAGNASYNKKKTPSTTGGAMAVTIDIPDLLFAPRNDMQIHRECREAIKRFNTSRKTFADYLKIKTGGCDEWSYLCCQHLIELTGHEAYRLAKHYLKREKAIAACLRWYGRGLTLKDSIRKVLVDQEVSANCSDM